jgi:hypothetical protein
MKYTIADLVRRDGRWLGGVRPRRVPHTACAALRADIARLFNVPPARLTELKRGTL